MFSKKEKDFFCGIISQQHHDVMFHDSAFGRREGISNWTAGFKINLAPAHESRRYLLVESSSLVNGSNNTVLGVVLPGHIFFVDAHGLTVSEKLYEREFKLTTSKDEVAYVQTWWLWHLIYDRKKNIVEQQKAVLSVLIWFFEQIPNPILIGWLKNELQASRIKFDDHEMPYRKIVSIKTLFASVFEKEEMSLPQERMNVHCKQLWLTGQDEVAQQRDEPNFLFEDIVRALKPLQDQPSLVPDLRETVVFGSELSCEHAEVSKHGLVLDDTLACDRSKHARHENFTKSGLGLVADDFVELPKDLHGIELYDLDSGTKMPSLGSWGFFQPHVSQHSHDQFDFLKGCTEQQLLMFQEKGELFSIFYDRDKPISGYTGNDLLMHCAIGVLELRNTSSTESKSQSI